MKSRTALALAVALGIAAGCVSVRPLAPGTVPELRSGEGILAVHVRTAIPIKKLALDQATVGSDLGKGEHLFLIAVSAGLHRWTDIVIPVGEGEIPLRMGYDDRWKVHIEAGRLNYAGLLQIEGRTHRKSVEMAGRYLNRSAFALERLRAQFPEIVARYPPVYAGPDRDDYLDYFTRTFLTRDAAAAAGGAP